jgi:Tol biopolymer transport system component
VGARAQLHIGLCYEKLGQQEAQQAYRRVIAEFPEHATEVAVARDRLAEIERSAAELNRQPTFREVEFASNPGQGALSPDGSFLAFTSDGALWTAPLHGSVDPQIAGEPVRLAEVPRILDVGGLLSWSANGEWIAVNSRTDSGDVVYVIPAAGGEPRVVPLPDRGGTHAQHLRLSLSPDGQRIAYSGRDPDAPEGAPDSDHLFIYAIPTAGGEPERVASVQGVMPAFSPDGEFLAFASFRRKRDWPEDYPRGQDLAWYDTDLWVAPTDGGEAFKLATVKARLRGPVWSPDGDFIAAHHEPGRDNLSRELWVYPFSGEPSGRVEPVVISLPRPSLAMPAGWTPEGELGVFLLPDESTAIYTVPSEGGQAVQVTPAGAVTYPRWSPDGGRIYFRAVVDEKKTFPLHFVPATGGTPAELPTESGGKSTSRVPGGGNHVSPDGTRIVFSGAPDQFNAQGTHIWIIPVDRGRPRRLLSDQIASTLVTHFPCWSPDGERVAFKGWTEAANDGFEEIYVVPADGGELRQVTSQADSVGAGAIAFSPDGNRIAFFSGDAIKTIPVEGGRPEVLLRGVISSRHGHLAYSPDGSRIAYRFGGKIWITSLDGGEPEELRTGLPANAELGPFDWSPDGERIAFKASISGESEFLLISDFLPKEGGR